MMEGHEKAIYRDMSSARNDVVCEVGWNSSTGDTVRITIGDRSAVIPYESLYGFVLMNSSGDKMGALLPVKQTVVREFVKQHIVEVKKPLRRGQQVVVNCRQTVPIAVVQALKGDLSRIDITPSQIVTPG